MEHTTVIVALPSLEEWVNKISSEEKAHLTMLFLGEADLSAEAMLYVQHACEKLGPFGLSVDYRGTLGEGDADVLFFEKNAWDLDKLTEFRHSLLLNDEIKRAFDAADQFPTWTPHLTLGHPETPANEDPEERRIGYVNFDRIAVWTGESSGPEFRLKSHYSNTAELSMSEAGTVQTGADAVAEIFHYGKKGMQWGVVNDEEGGSSASGTRPVALTAAENKADPDGPDRRALVKKAALIAGGLALVGGTAYVVSKNSSQADPRSVSTKKPEEKKDLQEPTSLIFLSRAKNKGLTFHETGDTPDYFSIFDKMGMNNDVETGSVFKATDGSGRVGTRFADPQGRRDFAGRPIAHDIVIPKNMADGINTIDDVATKIWPKIDAKYQKFWDENVVARSLRQSDEEGDSMTTVQTGADAVAELFHYGKKGMKWGVTNKDRAAERTPTDVTVTQTKPGTFAKTSGGANQSAHEDATTALAARQKAKASTTDALSNAELRAAVDRMQLEQRYSQLAFQSDRRSNGQKFIQGLLGKPRYDGKKDRKFTDEFEGMGNQTKDAVKTILDARKATTG